MINKSGGGFYFIPIFRIYNSMVIEDIVKENLIQRILQRCRCPVDRIDDAAQDLVLDWLQRPEGLDTANSKGYLLQYITAACKNKVKSINGERVMLDINDYKDVLQAED